MLLLGFHGTTKKNLYPKLSNKKWAPPCGWCPFFRFGKICKRRCLGSLPSKRVVVPCLVERAVVYAVLRVSMMLSVQFLY